MDEIMRAVPRQILIRKLNEKWSAQEHAGHLVDLEPLWLARIDDYVAGGSELTAADLTNRRTEEANHNGRPITTILQEFRETRGQLLSRLETMKLSLFAVSKLHPRLKKPMRLVDHLFFVAEHDDHHLAHIWNLITQR